MAEVARSASRARAGLAAERPSLANRAVRPRVQSGVAVCVRTFALTAGLWATSLPAGTGPPTGGPAPEEKGPSPEPTPSPPGRLRLDVEKHVEDLLEKEKVAPSLRFQESVVVVAKSPQLMLERYFRGINLECGATGGGAPTEIETRSVRPRPSAYIDFMPLVNAVLEKLREKQPPRFFLYRITRAGEVTYVVRPERVPAAWLHLPETTFEEVDSFPDLGSAVKGLRRLEKGFARAVPPVSSSPPPPWVTATPCRVY